MEASSPQLRVLVIDDDRDAAAILARVLELEGHAVRVVTDALKAIDAASAFRPQIILLDTAMPAQDGNEIARQIRQEPTLDDSIIVALSGYCAKSDREEALDSGADLFLAKPVKMATLREVLSAAHSLHYQLGST